METIHQSKESRKPELIGASVTLLVLPILAVLLRFLSRWMSRAGLWWDDFFIFLAMTFSWGLNIVNLLEIKHGGFGKHLPTPPDRAIFTWFKYLYVFEFMYAFAQTTNKLSIALFLHRIFPVAQFRRLLIYIIVFVLTLGSTCIIVNTFQCAPINAFWNTLAGQLSATMGGRCINVHLYFLISGAINAVSDFVLLALPIPLLWRLKTSRLQMMVLTAIFTLGLTVCGISVVRLVTLSRLQNADITWTYVTPSIWTAAESSITVVSACLPSLRPLFARVVWGRARRPPAKSPSSHRSLAASWRSGNVKDGHDGSFNRLPETWNNVAVHGGRAGSEDYEFGDTRPRPPVKGILVQTTVIQEINERLTYHDELF